MTVLSLTMTIFFSVSGGPYGLEPLMNESGAFIGLMLIIIIPIVWALPVALLTAELSSTMPGEGGYYIWVKRALGPMAGFFCAWLTYFYTWIDTAIYPVLFVMYLKSLPFGAILNDSLYAAVIKFCFIATLTWLNIRGARTIGNISVYFFALLASPFVLMIILGWHQAILKIPYVLHSFAPSNKSVSGAFSAGLFIIMWNYLGWDSLSTITGELKNPKRIFPKALMIGIVIVTLMYFMPIFIGITYQPDLSKWTEGSWPAISETIGGTFLKQSVIFCGLIFAAGLFMVSLLASSRIPFVLSKDKIFPSFFSKVHPKFGTPWVAIIISSIIYALLSFFSFKQLVEVDVIVYSFALILEIIALFILRLTDPTLDRPFKIPGGLKGLICIFLLPIFLIFFALKNMLNENGIITLVLPIIALVSGSLIWLLKRK